MATIPVCPTSDGHREATTLIIAPWKSDLISALLNASYPAIETSGTFSTPFSRIRNDRKCCWIYCDHISFKGTSSAYFSDFVGNVYSPMSANCFRDNVFDGLAFFRFFLVNCFLLFSPVRMVRCCRLIDTSGRFCGAIRSVTKLTRLSRWGSLTGM